MPIEYVMVKRVNPSDKKAPMKFYPQAKSTGETTLNEVCSIISNRSTASKGDVMLIVDGFVHTLLQELAKGRIVRMGDLGSFQINVSGEGIDSPEMFSNDMIDSTKIIFRPGKDLKEMLPTLTFEKTKP